MSVDTPFRIPSRAPLAFASAVIALVCASGCPEAVRRPPIVLVVVDTLRFDRCEAGPRSGTSSKSPKNSKSNPVTTLMPNWQRFAAGGVSFQNAVAASSWTGASVAAIFTGQQADQAGVRNLRDPLPRSVRTLAETLSDAGYRTRAVVSNGLIGADSGYAQGFDEFMLRDYKREGEPPARYGRPEFTADLVTDEALARLPQAADATFLYVHYTDPHDPYLAPEAYRQRAGVPTGVVSEERLLAMPDLRGDEVRGEIGAIRRHYDAEVAFVDDQLGRLLDALPEDAIVVLTSDHGDEFLEHQGLLHGRTLYQEVLRVPLVVKAPGIPPGMRIRIPVSHTDIAPTILDLAGLPAIPGASGDSLRPMWLGDINEAKPRILFSTLASGEREHVTARLGRWKLYLTRDQSLLFDLAHDPHERRDVSEAHPQMADRLQRAIDARRTLASHYPALDDTLDPEAHRRREQALRNLGYIE